MLRRVRASVLPSPAPPSEALPATSVSGDATASDLAVQPRRQRGSVSSFWLAAAALALGAFGGATLLLKAKGTAGAPSAPAAPAPTAAPTQGPVEAPSASSEAPEPRVELRVDSVPSGASVFVGDTELGKTPLDASVKRAAIAAPYRIVLAGFEPATGSIVLENDEHLVRNLVPARAPRARSDAPRPATPPTVASPPDSARPTSAPVIRKW
jgi:hypothetical protein